MAFRCRGDRVESGIFGQTAKFGQRPCLFHITNIGIKHKLHCLQMCVRIYLMSEVTRLYPSDPRLFADWIMYFLTQVEEDVPLGLKVSPATYSVGTTVEESISGTCTRLVNTTTHMP